MPSAPDTFPIGAFALVALLKQCGTRGGSVYCSLIASLHAC
ncbi:MAG: hypothetical protein WC617_09850 [Rhodanobacter sp.]|jgi:hypothetical protein